MALALAFRSPLRDLCPYLSLSLSPPLSLVGPTDTTTPDQPLDHTLLLWQPLALNALQLTGGQSAKSKQFSQNPFARLRKNHLVSRSVIKNETFRRIRKRQP